MANQLPFDSHQIDVFDKLDDYSLLNILDKLNYGDLMNAASAIPRISQLLWGYNFALKLRIESATLYIEVEGEYQLLEALYRPVGESRTKVLCAGHAHILATLATFCPAFGQLELTLNYFHPHNVDATQKLIDAVNRYCATVPQKVTIKNGGGSIAEFTAQHATSVMVHNPEKLANFSMHAHFPQVERLTIFVDRRFAIPERLPHVKHFELLEGACGHFDLRTFAALNAQIRSVKLDLCDGLDSVREVNEIFPDLLSLYYKPKRMEGHAVRRQSEGDQLVRFANVTSYTIDLFHYYYYHYQQDDDAFHAHNFAKLSLIQFDRLDALEYITVDRFYRDGQVGLVTQYEEVTRLDYSSYGMAYEEVWRLVEAMPMLTEIRIRLNERPGDHRDFLQLMEQTKLVTIRAFVDDAMVDAFRTLILPERWLLSADGLISSNYGSGQCLTFKRNTLAIDV